MGYSSRKTEFAPGRLCMIAGDTHAEMYTYSLVKFQSKMLNQCELSQISFTRSINTFLNFHYSVSILDAFIACVDPTKSLSFMPTNYLMKCLKKSKETKKS